MTEELSVISFDSNKGDIVYDFEEQIINRDEKKIVKSEDEFQEIEDEIIDCLGKLQFSTSKKSSQTLGKDEESFSNINMREIWDEDNRDDSGIFETKFENLKQSQKVKAKFPQSGLHPENIFYKEVNKGNNRINDNFINYKPTESKNEPYVMQQDKFYKNNQSENVIYPNSHTISPNFTSASSDIRRLRQNFVGNGMSQQLPQQFPLQNLYMNRNFMQQSMYVNNEGQYNQNGMSVPQMARMNPMGMMGHFSSPTSPMNNLGYNLNLNSPSNSQNNPFQVKGGKKKKNNIMQKMRNLEAKRDVLDDEQNQINLEKVLRKRDKRTTVMIRHIPNKYNIKTFLEEINMEFKGKYDVFYLPIDYVNNCNLGFAFINFVDPMHVILFYERFRGRKWKRFNSEKICELAYAKFQGKKELIAHFEKGSVLNFVSEDKRPMILPTPNSSPKVELPLKYLNAFNVIYPYGAYSPTGKDTVAIEALYSF